MNVIAILLALVVMPAYACRTADHRYRATYGHLLDPAAELSAQRKIIKQLATTASLIARVYVPEQSMPVDGADSRLRFVVRKLWKGSSDGELFARIPGGVTVVSCGAPPSFWLDKNPIVEVNREYFLYLRDGVVLRVGSTRSRAEGLISVREEALMIRRASRPSQQSR